MLRIIARLLVPLSGHVSIHGALERQRFRTGFVFQDATLLPWRTAAANIRLPGELEQSLVRDSRVHELAQLVGLSPNDLQKRPAALSGGMKMRVSLARALALEPDVIICDEPVSALDVSIQAQVINLMEELQDLLGLTYLFISHDLGMIRHIADRVAVMYLGKIMELADVDSLYADPLHPYTRALQSSAPVPDPVVEATRVKILLKGDIPSSSNPPPGCPFSTRCPEAVDRCRNEVPVWREVAPGHGVACHLVGG